MLTLQPVDCATATTTYTFVFIILTFEFFSYNKCIFLTAKTHLGTIQGQDVRVYVFLIIAGDERLKKLN